MALLLFVLTALVGIGLYGEGTPFWSIDVERAAVDPRATEERTCAGGQEFVEPDTANLRAGPGANHPVTQRVEKAMIVTICEERDGWKRIEVPGRDLAGWIRGDLTSGNPAFARESLRAVLASKLEQTFLDNYQDARVRALGSKKTKLSIRLPYVSRVRAHHLQKEINFHDLKAMGFTTVELVDEGNRGFTWSLE